ncbi:MAG TPA: peptidoglycan-binding domain-containing protein [Iamia sp.]|nr:peptidoglycan-binding domain-containing protein [Iamia sp.]
MRRLGRGLVGVAAAAATTVTVAGAAPAGADGFDNDGSWGDNHTISGGSTGNNVAVWELMLITMDGCFPGINGHFGGSTSNDNAATRWFQGAHGLTADGIVGTATWSSAKNHLGYVDTDANGTHIWDYGWGSGGHAHAFSGSFTMYLMNVPTNAWKRGHIDPGTHDTNHPTFTGSSMGAFVC